MMMLLIRGAIFRLELSGSLSKFNTDSMWPIYYSDNTEDNMQMMICCISKGHKIYESIQAHTPPMHTLSESGRCVSAMYLMILGWKKKGGDNLRGSLDKVTNVEAFEGGAGSASWGHDLALLRLLKGSTKYFTLVL